MSRIIPSKKFQYKEEDLSIEKEDDNILNSDNVPIGKSIWTKIEDEALKKIVNLAGPSNWKNVSLLMAKKFGIKNKSSKQCRERWINSLSPNINKGVWSEEEENILFSTQLKIGNKWSDLAKLLPGRSENDIKNHFYSKLRKYIRKICKELHKSKFLESKGINSSLYSANIVYSLIQIENIPLIYLSKKTIINAIQKDFLHKQEKQERLNNLKESSSYCKYDSTSSDIDCSFINSIHTNQFLKEKIFNNSLHDFNSIENKCESDDDEHILSSYINKKRNGVNIFEELLSQDN